jgi:hypothetical protein
VLQPPFVAQPVTAIERLRWAIAPVQGRSSALLWGGIAVFLGLGALVTYVELPRPVIGLAVLGMAGAWLAGACGMVGYVRWHFGVSSSEQRAFGIRGRSDAEYVPPKEKKP